MKRRTVRLVVEVAAFMAAMMMVSAVPAFASANSDAGGNASIALGQVDAAADCTYTIPFFLCGIFS